MKLFSGSDYLKMDIAARFGLDKNSWQDRLIWFYFNERDLHSLIGKAKEPAQFYAGILAYEDYLAGKESGYMISLDQTASGLQLLCAMAKDAVGAQYCNVSNQDIKDFYTEAYKKMKEIDPSINVDREGCKKAIMTAFYNSTATPKRIFGEDKLPVFYRTIQEMAPSAWSLNQAFDSLTDKNASEYNWVLPDNFDVKIAVENSVKHTVQYGDQVHEVIVKEKGPTDYDKSLSPNLTHSLEAYLNRELIRRCGKKPIIMNQGEDEYKDLMVQVLWELYQESGMLSVRILDYITTYNMKYVDEKEIIGLYDKFSSVPFEILTIHDNFKCLPAYGNQLRKVYRELFKELCESRMALFLIEQLSGVKANAVVSEDLAGIEIGEYLIC